MNDLEKRAIAVARELTELQKIVKAFDHVVRDAQQLADECKASAERCHKIINDDTLDRAIDNLDYLMKRGNYAVCDHSAGNFGKTNSGIEYCLDCDGCLDDPAVKKQTSGIMQEFDNIIAAFKLPTRSDSK